MDITQMPILTILIFLPVAFAVILAVVPKSMLPAIRGLALAACILDFIACIPLYFQFDATRFQFQFVEHHAWMQNLGISYHLGIDGLSLFLVQLTCFLGILSVWFSYYVKDRVKEYMIFMLLLQAGMIGVFCALDLVLFYIFWEAMLIPMYFLIGIWGGDNRRYAAIKFFLYTFAGSIFMLLAVIGLYVSYQQVTGQASFDLVSMQKLAANGELIRDTGLQFWLFLAFAVAFAIKVPMFPFHTWLPDAHVEAPTAGSVILAGVLLKMGTYGFFRFCMPLFPDMAMRFVPIIIVMSVIAIIYGAIVAAVQTDVKKLVAYSSVSHLGFCTLGLFSLNAIGMTGAMLQQINHGLSTGALFLLVGMIYERRHTRMFSDFGGLKAKMPVYAAMFLIVMLSSVGLPSLNGFIGEFYVLLGTYQTAVRGLYGTSLWMIVVAAGGVVLAAVYLLWMFQKMFYGPVTNPKNEELKDIKMFEKVILAAIIVFIFWIGLYPGTFTDKMMVSVHALRLQVTESPHFRPVWDDPSQVVQPNGDMEMGGGEIKTAQSQPVDRE